MIMVRLLTMCFQMFPALGFGARVPPSGQVSHEFFLTLDPTRPFCAGVEGIVSAYYNSLNTVQLYGPTNFAPVINHVANFAAAHQSEATNYFVLLILTDGIITDFDDTKRALVGASSLPMSVIIVGIGDEDFAAMDILDGDQNRLQYQGQVAKRDIVQFAEMQKFVSREGGWRLISVPPNTQKKMEETTIPVMTRQPDSGMTMKIFLMILLSWRRRQIQMAARREMKIPMAP